MSAIVLGALLVETLVIAAGIAAVALRRLRLAAGAIYGVPAATSASPAGPSVGASS